MTPRPGECRDGDSTWLLGPYLILPKRRGSMMDDNENHDRRRRERAVTIFGTITAAMLGVVVATHVLPAAAGVFAVLAR